MSDGIKPFVFKTKESIAFLQNKKFCSCNFSMKGGAYYLSVTYEKTNHTPATKGGRVGLDLGIKHPVAAFDGTNSFTFDLPESLEAAKKKTEYINHLFSRSKKDSKRHELLRLRLDRAYAREANLKKEYREKLTYWLAANYAEIVIDDYSFESALSLKNVKRALYEASSYIFKLRLKQKAEKHGCKIIVIEKGTPTTQVCSHCGHRPAERIDLSVRTYVCEACGFTVDRDINSAMNAYKYCL